MVFLPSVQLPRAAVPNLFGTGTGFVEDNFSTDRPGVEGRGGGVFRQ